MDTAEAPHHDQSEFKEIPLTKGLVAFVDPDDFERLSKYRWHFAGYISLKGRPNGYAYRSEGGEKIAMHREIMGVPPQDLRIVGHVNGHYLDNRKKNLFIVNKHGDLDNVHNLPGRDPYPAIQNPSLDSVERSFLSTRVRDDTYNKRWRSFVKLKEAILHPETYPTQ